MCGRFAFSTPLAVFIDTFDGFDFSELMGVHQLRENAPEAGRFNIAPTQDVPVVPNDGSKRVQLFRWGLVPRWAKDPAIGNRMINARSETLAEKPSFREAFRKRRCLMLADGFYEWRANPGTKTKTPIHIRLRSGKPFAFAGLWDSWTPKDGQNAGAPPINTSKTGDGPEPYGPGRPLRTCTIITTRANELMAQFHHRMPVILPKEHYGLWLAEEPLDPEILQPLFVSYPPEKMVAYPVSTAVNNPRNNSADLVVQVAPAIEQPELGI